MKALAGILFCLPISISTACASQGLPADVEAFITSRDICDHLRGEIPDRPSATDIKDIQASCRGADRRLGALKAKYRDDKAVMERLSVYENPIDRTH